MAITLQEVPRRLLNEPVKLWELGSSTNLAFGKSWDLWDTRDLVKVALLRDWAAYRYFTGFSYRHALAPGELPLFLVAEWDGGNYPESKNIGVLNDFLPGLPQHPRADGVIPIDIMTPPTWRLR